MPRKYGKRSRRSNKLRSCLAAVVVLAVIAGCVLAAHFMQDKLDKPVENAGMQLTSHIKEDSAQVYMNGRWYARRDVETLLLMGIDNFGELESSKSYNNTNQADFLVLIVRDRDTGENTAIHINRDTMTDVTVLGVTGDNAGTIEAQIAISFAYGTGGHDSCKNAARAVTRLLYGMEVDHYMTFTMDAVPIANDWVGGVEVEVIQDFSGVVDEFVMGETVKLMGDQALRYVRARRELEGGSNLNRMERQRQYAAKWLEKAQLQFEDAQAALDLFLRLDGYYYSDCTIDQMADMAEGFDSAKGLEMIDLPGEAVSGDVYMEYHVDEEALQQLVLDVFYKPVGN